MKDSMHIYVIDAEQILLPNDYLSEDLIEKIEPEMILTRMTVTHGILIIRELTIGRSSPFSGKDYYR